MSHKVSRSQTDRGMQRSDHDDAMPSAIIVLSWASRGRPPSGASVDAAVFSTAVPLSSPTRRVRVRRRRLPRTDADSAAGVHRPPPPKPPPARLRWRRPSDARLVTFGVYAQK